MEKANQYQSTKHNPPKWAALVDDEVIPMPQQKVKASVIKAQASLTNGRVLVRDHNSPADVLIRDEDEVDLAERKRVLHVGVV